MAVVGMVFVRVVSMCQLTTLQDSSKFEYPAWTASFFVLIFPYIQVFVTASLASLVETAPSAVVREDELRSGCLPALILASGQQLSSFSANII